jgi:hypothetical protein
MNDSPLAAQLLASFPALLRELIQAELKAGNTIVEVASKFPAPPAGAYVMLEKPISTRPRATAGGVTFFARNTSSYAGEFTDPERFYFVIEAPLPPEPPPDMDVIRNALNARQRASDAARDEEFRRG